MENNYLIVDDIFETDAKPILKETLEKYTIPQRGKVISGTFGVFNAKEFKNAMWRNNPCLK